MTIRKFLNILLERGWTIYKWEEDDTFLLSHLKKPEVIKVRLYLNHAYDASYVSIYPDSSHVKDAFILKKTPVGDISIDADGNITYEKQVRENFI